MATAKCPNCGSTVQDVPKPSNEMFDDDYLYLSATCHCSKCGNTFKATWRYTWDTVEKARKARKDLT